MERQQTHLDAERTAPEPFPLGVDPIAKRIVEDPAVYGYLENHNVAQVPRIKERNWFTRILAWVGRTPWYQNLASSVSRVVVIYSGERHEEVVDHFGDILGWNNAERARFSETVTMSPPRLSDGTFFPGHYVFAVGTTPEEAAAEVNARFDTEIRDRYTQDIEVVVPLEEALVIASLIEREAYDFTDMRLISGVIWNRRFADMKLQLDASLQYAKGSLVSTPEWWPTPVPEDKYLDSPYNTYQNAGLPPAPISNPSVEAILATLNPTPTDCLFYFHDEDAEFHCSETYEEHVALLKQYYGRGK